MSLSVEQLTNASGSSMKLSAKVIPQVLDYNGILTTSPTQEFFSFALQDPTLVEPFIESFVRATIAEGHPVVARLPEFGIVGVGLFFGPGQASLVTEHQKDQGFNQLMQRVNEDTRKWFTEYFIKEMLHKLVEPAFGPGVQHDNYHLQIFGVSPNHQGKDIGKAILQQVEAKAKSEGVDVVLETLAPENVVRYGKMGYEVQGTAHFNHPSFSEPRKITCLRKRLH
ncbi:hypothetical protein PQX77_020760 [Marasmius sp. AFHP31]|nr:hypothetical protein PQX77_020760 [Marasmius sp. AFHP31]